MSRSCWLVFCLAACVEAGGLCAADSRDGYRATAAALPEAIPLRPRGAPPVQTAGAGERQGKSTGQTLTTIVGGLAVCLGAFLLFAWVSRRHAPAGTAPLPREVIELLGRVPFNGRQNLQLLRVGRKLVLLHVSATGAGALTEITDPAEVDHLVGLCQQSRPSSVTASFQEVLTRYESEPAARSFLGDARAPDWEPASSGSRRGSRREDRDD